MINVVILGSGPMACEYSKVLQAMQIPFTVIGRSEQSTNTFHNTTGIKAISGGYEQYFATNKHSFSHAIIAVGEKRLGEAARATMNAGITTILVEKPGGIDAEDIRNVAQSAKLNNAQVLVGYNRRFYASVEKAKSIIAEDGGLLSFNFEFTEWGHVIANIEKEEGVKENWFLANSSHVIDLAFHLGGAPRVLNAHTAGALSWHPRAAIYAGSGISEQGALFSYQANWQAPGRWALEFLTRQHRLYFKPVEKLQIQKLGSVALEEVILDDALDFDFKPGLYKQTQAFINNPSLLPSIEEQVSMLDWYEQINTPSTL
ncbi:Gfo/Idh/MocA family oxidoreductase [Legionella quateirensis]|uniref:Dehydrogenase n=1 Tax=Legionella quateirensis TaxID=45072 RepID=A0A378KZ22_9GAMM|nr:Gfo/Idh/MocA family oxidoreductase [Legionella quateirensis]KTD47627.1 putative dehydrogenase [Legionella quateirensis]STY18618.1 putative dehydrogenase [Legionella quateirensis]